MKYRAFISYSRKDVRVANRIHRALERYRAPGNVDLGNRKRSLGRFFKDDDELAGSEHLGAALDGAIDDSENLIVIASPDAAQSDWVNKEVLRFKQRGRGRVFAIIARGTPDSNDPAFECFPPALRYQLNSDGMITEERADPPLAPDLTQESFSRAFIRLAAGLLNISFDDLWLRERRRRLQRRAILCVIAMVSFVTAILIMATSLTRNDVSILRARSVEVSMEQWRYHGEGPSFDPAFRAALGASLLDHRSPEEPWDLNSPSDSTSRAFGLCGRALRFRRIYGQPPDLSKRGNFRDDIPSADPARRVAIHSPVNVRSVCFSGDSKRVGLCVSDGQVHISEVFLGVVRFSHNFKDVNAGSRMALNESGEAALVTGKGRVYFIDVESGKVKICPSPEFDRFHDVNHVAGRWVLVASRDRAALVCEFDPAVSKITRSVEIPEFTPYYSNAFSEGSIMFVGYDSWQGLTPVSTNFGKEASIRFRELGLGVGQVKAIATDRTGRLVALGGNGSGGGKQAGVQLVELKSASETTRLIGHTGEIYATDFMPHTHMVVTGGSDLSVRLWDSRTGHELLRLAGHVGDVYVARFSRNGELLATSSSDGVALLWDVKPLKQIGKRPLWASIFDADTEGVWQIPPTVVTVQERDTTSAFQGRPWNIREWRDPFSMGGAVQSVRAMFVRWFGWSVFDY